MWVSLTVGEIGVGTEETGTRSCNDKDTTRGGLLGRGHHHSLTAVFDGQEHPSLHHVDLTLIMDQLRVVEIAVGALLRLPPSNRRARWCLTDSWQNRHWEYKNQTCRASW